MSRNWDKQAIEAALTDYIEKAISSNASIEKKYSPVRRAMKPSVSEDGHIELFVLPHTGYCSFASDLIATFHNKGLLAEGPKDMVGNVLSKQGDISDAIKDNFHIARKQDPAEEMLSKSITIRAVGGNLCSIKIAVNGDTEQVLDCIADPLIARKRKDRNIEDEKAGNDGEGKRQPSASGVSFASNKRITYIDRDGQTRSY